MLAFVHIHKTAGTTLASILKRSFGARHCNAYSWSKDGPYFSAADYRRLHRLYSSLESMLGHEIRAYSDLEEACPAVAYYTFVRDPLVRCASHYQYDRQRGGVEMRFEEWIQDDKTHDRQVRHIAGPEPDAQTAIALLEDNFFFVGLVERFDESLVLFQNVVGPDRLQSIHYFRKWAAPDDVIKDRLLNDRKTRALLEDANRMDLELYEHVTREIYPRQRSDYGPGLDEAVTAFQASNRHTKKSDMYLTRNYIGYLLKWRLAYLPTVSISRGLSRLPPKARNRQKTKDA
ncbi:MAG: sulfotransferase family 2 domain-containing protein [Acidimicrobiia bacterium]